MRPLITLLTLLWLLPPIGSQAGEPDRPSSPVPCPASLVPGTGAFRFTGNTVIATEDTAQARTARGFAALFTRTAGFTPRVKAGSRKGDVVLLRDASLPSEGYRLETTPARIRIHASSDAGFFYALQTLRQLLPPAIETGGGDNPIDINLNTDTGTPDTGNPDGTPSSWTVPAMTVTDSPRFGYRGLMMDVARFFTPKEDLLRLIDCMGMLKLNRLHLHLTDDNGWRLEIRRYPLLTEVGSRRVERPGMTFPERRNARQGEPTAEKGYYTQDDIREIVAHAAARHIEVIPEIEMPAHSNAALAAYPLLACPVVDKYIGVLPGLGGDHADIIYCAGNDSVYTFLEHILDEVTDLFPSRYIHLGGDEAWKTHWKECPLCQARIRQEGLADEEALQGYFMARMARYVRDKGREVMGWDELTNTDIPEDAVIFGWQGYGQAAVKAARLGHRFVMTPAKVTYLIRYQGPQWFEPITYFGNNTLKDVYGYDPVEKGWTPQVTDLLMGVQASLWTEFCGSVEDVHYLLFPRLSALAEAAWTQPDRKDWGRFLRAMDGFNGHLEAMGIRPARSMYNIQHKVTPKDGALQVSLECIRPDVEIRYEIRDTRDEIQGTRDKGQGTAGELTGTETGLKTYAGPLTVSKDAVIRAATFKDGVRTGSTLTLPLSFNPATARPVSGDNPAGLKLLVNGVRGSLKHTDSEWCSWTDKDTVSFTVDLQEPQAVSRVTLGCITVYGTAVHKPSRITVEVSDDNRTFRPFGGRTYTPEEIFSREGRYIEDCAVTPDAPDTAATARYIRVTLTGPGKCPRTHVRPGQTARMCLDEILIE